MIKFLKRLYKKEFNCPFLIQRSSEVKKLDERLKQFDWLIPKPNSMGMIEFDQNQKEAKRLGADQLYFIAKRQQELLKGLK